MPIDPDKLAQFRHFRRHGASLETAARKADLTLDEAHKAEGRFYCPNCPAETGPYGGAYVPYSECPHWDYETLCHQRLRFRDSDQRKARFRPG